MPELKDLLQVYGHIQRDIESVKHRQWRDFQATLLGQSGVLFLWDRLHNQETELFIALSVMVWAAGVWFLIEHREVLVVYRKIKEDCAKALKQADADLYKIIDPPGLPLITGKLHFHIYFLTTFLATLLVIVILRQCRIAWECTVVTSFFMVIGAGILNHIVQVLIKDK